MKSPHSKIQALDVTDADREADSVIRDLKQLSRNRPIAVILADGPVINGKQFTNLKIQALLIQGPLPQAIRTNQNVFESLYRCKCSRIPTRA